MSPIRGGISKGLIYFEDGGTLGSLSNFKYTSEIGHGMVEAAILEKNGPKGMRLFLAKHLEKELAPTLSKSCKINQDKDKTEIIEYNWMHSDSFIKVYLDESLRHVKMRDHLKSFGSTWSANGNQYQQLVGNSVLELLGW